MIEELLPIIASYILGVVSTVVGVIVWIWNKKRKMKNQMNEMISDMGVDTDG